jgi:kanamycin kinase
VTGADVTVPTAVASAAGSRTLRLVWANEAEGLTFAADEDAGRRFIKWAPAGSGLDLAAEAEQMAWAAQYHPVPEPLACGHDDAGSWLVTAALPGDRASRVRWKADPATAVTAIGEGLRALHEALPAARCPFSWSAAGAFPTPAGRRPPGGWTQWPGTRATGH